ncbi:MAG: POTRA domain-containing protein, partial [bacterium]
MSSRWKRVHTSRLLLATAAMVVVMVVLLASAVSSRPVVVDIRGNSLFSDDALRRLFADAQSVRAGIKRIETAYISRGYLMAAIDTEPAGNDSTVIIRIEEGEPARVRSVTVHGMESFSEERMRRVLDVRTGDAFRPDALERSIERLLGLYDTSGFPFAQVWIDSLGLDANANAVDLSVYVVEGGEQTIHGVNFEGLEHTRRDLALKLTGLEPGEVYSGELLRESYLRLMSSGVFEAVSYPAVQMSPEGGGVEVLIKVLEPPNNNAFSAALGYADREGEEDKVLSGFVNLDLANIGGSLRDLSVNWRNDGKGRSQTQLEFRERFFFGKRMSMGVTLEQIGQDTLYTWQSLGLESSAPIGRLWGGLFGVDLAAHGDRNTFSEGAQASSRRVRLIGGVNFVEGKENRGDYIEFRSRQAYAHKWIRMRDKTPDQSVSQFISEIRAAGTVGLARHLHGYVE